MVCIPLHTATTMADAEKDHPDASDEDDGEDEGKRDRLLPSAPPLDLEAAMERIWLSFFNQVFVIAEEAVRWRKLPLADIRQEEPYLYLGLIGATVLQCAVRSSRRSDRTGLVLADPSAEAVQWSHLPPVHRFPFQTLQHVVDQLPTHPDDLWCLEQLVLYGQSEHKVVTVLEPSALVPLQRLAAKIQGVAIHISQQAIFRDQFKNVLSLLLSVYHEI